MFETAEFISFHAITDWNGRLQKRTSECFLLLGEL